MVVVQYLFSFPESDTPTSVVWLSKKTDWWKLLQLPDVSWLQFLFAGAFLVVLIWAILRLVARVNEDVDPADADQEMLSLLNELRREGDLSEDEFRSIKGQIVGRLSTSLNAKARSKPPAGIAGLADILAKADRSSEIKVQTESAANEQSQKAIQSDQLESFASPTNVPNSLQDTRHLTERSIPDQSENGEGNMEAGPPNQEKKNEASQDDL